MDSVEAVGFSDAEAMSSDKDKFIGRGGGVPGYSVCCLVSYLWDMYHREYECESLFLQISESWIWYVFQ